MNRRGFIRGVAVTISVMALAAHIKGAHIRQWWLPEGFRPADYDEWGLSTAEFLAGPIDTPNAIRTFRQNGKTNMQYEYMRYMINKS